MRHLKLLAIIHYACTYPLFPTVQLLLIKIKEQKLGHPKVTAIEILLPFYPILLYYMCSSWTSCRTRSRRTPSRYACGTDLDLHAP